MIEYKIKRKLQRCFKWINKYKKLKNILIRNWKLVVFLNNVRKSRIRQLKSIK